MTRAQAISHHYQLVWKDQFSRCIERRWQRGPIHELPSEFRILEFAPATFQGPWRYATCCMSQPADESAIELVLLAPSANDSNVELLTVICHYHRTAARLDLGHTVNFGRPWLPQSQCTHGLISLPYIDGPRLEYLDSSLSVAPIRFLWLVPITGAERDFQRQWGLDALEQRMEQSGFNFLDPLRNTVIQPGESTV